MPTKNDLQNILEEIKARVSIADVVGAKVKLIKRGRDYVGLCPFHHEKTPSFSVNTAQGYYHCFGCGEHGDIFSFEMKNNGLSFMDAVHKLADKAGVVVPTLSKESIEQQQKRKSFYEIMELAVAFYEKKLRLSEGALGLAYFKGKRGLSEDTIKKFRLGYAPNGSALKAELTSKGIDAKDLEQLGLITNSDDGKRNSYDFFYDRVMIPIMDKRGRPIAFGGRIMDKSEPKYLNSPETPIFNKRRILFNMNNAQEPAHKANRLIVCEGYMDVIALDSFGFSYAVAPLGTALTEEQISEAWKMCPTPILCFDGDSAGIRAAIRSIDRVLPILKAGYSVKYIFLKNYKDPDELLHNAGAETFEQYLQKAKPLVDVLWHKCKMNRTITTPEEKALLEKDTLAEVAKIQDAQIRNYYAQEMKNRLRDEFGLETINKKPLKEQKKSKQQIYNFVKKPPLDDMALRKIAANLILYPQLSETFSSKLSNFEFGTSVMAKILTEILNIYEEEGVQESADLQEKLRMNYPAQMNELWQIDMIKKQNPSIPDARKEINSCLISIQLKQLDSEINECSTLIKNQPENFDELYQKYENLKKERNRLLQLSEE